MFADQSLEYAKANVRIQDMYVVPLQGRFGKLGWIC